jgi:hypothetical protein
MAEHVQEKLKDIFDNTIDSSFNFDGDVTKPDFYSVFCKAAAENNFHKLMGSNLCMLNCKYESKDSIMMLFSIPINAEESGSKTVAERVMEIVREVEECFTTLDYLKSTEVREDKVVYVTAIKKLNGG